MLFRYFQEGDSIAEDKISRVVNDEDGTEVNAFLLRLVDGTDLEVPEGKTADEVHAEAEADGVPVKYHETDFKTWWDNCVADDSKAKWTEEAEAGTFHADIGAEEGLLVCSLEDGESIEVDASEAEESSEEKVDASA